MIRSSRERLLAGLAVLRARSDEVRASWREKGRAARAEKLGLEANPHNPGSWGWTRWLEGWSNTSAPERRYELDGWTMTPAEELEKRLAWLAAVGVGEEDRGAAALLLKQGYTPEAIGGVQ